MVLPLRVRPLPRGDGWGALPLKLCDWSAGQAEARRKPKPNPEVKFSRGRMVAEFPESRSQAPPITPYSHVASSGPTLRAWQRFLNKKPNGNREQDS